MSKKQLYPLKFKSIPKERVWGGNRFGTAIGESWVISGFEEESSDISNGYLEGNALYDIIETYMGEIVGDETYKYFGNEFPLLIKILDIKDKLSVQVHPDDETAYDRHNSYGKSEAWYILDAEEDSVIYMGFNRDMDPNEFYQRCKEGKVEECLNCFHPKKGDFFYIEPGTVHSAGKGLVIAEIAQICDVTYRLYDWGRENDPKTARQMHHELAFDCINYTKFDTDANYIPATHRHEQHILTENPYFKVTSLDLSDPLHIYTEKYESFILYCCVKGGAQIGEGGCTISEGEWVMIPAGYSDFILSATQKETTLLEVYIVKQEEKDSYVAEEEHHHHEEGCNCGCHDHKH
ncbi:MAG: class I mannose-6-phosphate isomerase [Bacteroidales bacterium]|nr:class I mannose-6-phosphate isomerase [Bacteroidales bacterium]